MKQDKILKNRIDRFGEKRAKAICERKGIVKPKSKKLGDKDVGSIQKSKQIKG